MILKHIEEQSVCSDEVLSQAPFLKTARQVSPAQHLAIQDGFQGFLDDSIAKTINLPESASIDCVLSSIWYAYNFGLKGVAVFLDNCLSQRKGGECKS